MKGKFLSSILNRVYEDPYKIDEFINLILLVMDFYIYF